MPKVIDDGFAEELRRQYYQLRDRVDRLDRDMATRQKFAPREDFVMLQASTTGAIPAVTASTAGITPGKTTVAKMLTINTSDAAVRNTSDRTVTAYNIGAGSIAAGKPFPAHRDFLTGKFVTWGDATGAAGGSNAAPVTICYNSTLVNITAATTYYVNFPLGGISYGANNSTRTCPVVASTSDNSIKFTRTFHGHVAAQFSFNIGNSTLSVAAFNVGIGEKAGASGTIDFGGTGSAMGMVGGSGSASVSAACIGRAHDFAANDILYATYVANSITPTSYGTPSDLQFLRCTLILYENVLGTSWVDNSGTT